MNVENMREGLRDLLRFFAADSDAQRQYLPASMPISLCEFGDVRFATDKPRLILAERCEWFCASNLFLPERSIIAEIRSVLEIMTESDAHYPFLFGEPDTAFAEANESIMRLWDVLRRLSAIALTEEKAGGSPKRSFEQFYSEIARPIAASQTAWRVR